MEKVSILIASFNNGKFIGECIESALKQKNWYPNIEIICCDDCSTDESLDIIKKNSKEIKILINDSHLGVGKTKKILIENSTGDYFIFLDSDDVLEENCLQILISSFLINNNLSIVYSDSYTINERNDIIQNGGRSKKIFSELIDETYEYPIFHLVMYNRQKYNLTDGIDEFMLAAVDMDLWLKMDEVGDIFFIDEKLYYYRKNINGISQNFGNTKKKIELLLWQNYCILNACKRRKVNPYYHQNRASVIIEAVFNIKKDKSFYSKFLDYFRQKIYKLL